MSSETPTLADYVTDWVRENDISSNDLLRQMATLMMGLAQQWIDEDAEEENAEGQIYFSLPSDTNYMTDMTITTYYYDKERLN